MNSIIRYNITIMSTMQSSTMATSKFIKTSEWDVQANRYMQPRVSDRGIKMVSIISNQRNKKLHLQLPSMVCYGIEDFTDRDTGESDGKFKIKLQFRDDGSDESREALAKLQLFEEQVLNDAVANSEPWFGKKLSRELVEDRYFPFLKVGKNKETKEPDPSRGYYFAPKVNCYSGKWDLEIFDQERTMKFPSEDESATPMDFVPSGSEVTCGIECKYIWLGAKGWGISWALKQVMVVPKYSENIAGKCQLDGPLPVAPSNAPVAVSTPPPVAETPTIEENKQYVADSDDEVEPEAVVETTTTTTEPEPEPVVEQEPEPEAPKPKKTIVKKAVATEEAPTEAAAAPVKKKVVRKKV